MSRGEASLAVAALQRVKQYFHHSDPQRVIAERALARLVLRGDERILDWGCGDGKLSATLGFRVPAGSVLGMDVSREMVQFAAKKYPREWYPNVGFLQVPAADQPGWTAEHSFDLVVSFSVLHVVPDPAATVAKMASLLAPGGRLLVASTGPADPRYLETLRSALERCGVPVPPFGDMRRAVDITRKDQLAELFTRAGFGRVRIEEVDASYVFADAAEFVAWSKGVGSSGWGMPEEMERKFYDHLVQESVRLDPAVDRGDGAIAMRFPHLITLAERE